MSTLQASHVEAVEPNESQHAERPSLLHAFTGATPWWVVSTLLHVLIIALASLISISIALATNDDYQIVMCVCVPPPYSEPLQRPRREVGPNSPCVPPTDPTSNVSGDVEVTPDILAHAELDTHFETIDPERPDTHSAFGVEAHIFDRVQGNDDPPGGSSSEILNNAIGDGGTNTFGHALQPGHGIGNDLGDGDGNWGSRSGGGRHLRVMRHCGSVATESSSEAGLQWLAYHQESDGHWDTVKFGSGQKTDTAMTGMAILAFAGAGHSERVGQYKDTVKRAVAWLKSKQQPNGLIFDSTDAGAHRGIGYPHAIATLGLVEAAGMGNVKETRAAAQRAIDYAIDIHQQGDGSDKLGWRYAPKTPGDLSVTGWFVMAMKSAKIAGLHVNPATFEGAIKFLDSVEFKDAGADAAYGGSHFGYQPGNEHAGSGHRLTAIGSLVRQFCGWSREQTQGSVDWFVNKGGVPQWGANGESVDLYYWYYGSLSTFQQGGDVWKRWNAGMMKALTENQCKNGDDAGSWPIAGEFSGEWGRVGQTAMAALCLEVYYRYERLKN